MEDSWRRRTSALQFDIDRDGIDSHGQSLRFCRHIAMSKTPSHDYLVLSRGRWAPDPSWYDPDEADSRAQIAKMALRGKNNIVTKIKWRKPRV